MVRPRSAPSTPRRLTQPDGTPLTLTADSAVTLTIQPGVVLFANSGPSWVNINRGNKINAVGTATAPIVFTSRDNVLGLNTDSSSGQWGGVVLSGRAQVTDCAAPAATPGTVACERQTEGAVDPALYGGANNLDNSGTMSYVQIRYSGYILSSNVELQSLTTEGVGEGTKIDHIMAFNSSDDGAEFFGGHVGLKYYISVGAEDDNLDTDTGIKGQLPVRDRRPAREQRLGRRRLDHRGGFGQTASTPTRRATTSRSQTSPSSTASTMRVRTRPRS